MKQESTAKYVLRLAVTLLLITAIVAGLLAAVNAVTAPYIAANKQRKTQAALEAVMDAPETAVKLDTIPAGCPLVVEVYENETGYAIQVAPIGFNAEIYMMVGVTRDGTVKGISVISQTETAGLGAVCAAKNSAGEAFRGQFAGLSGKLTVNQDIDAISSATITSKAVVDGVNAALECAAKLGG